MNRASAGRPCEALCRQSIWPWLCRKICNCRGSVADGVPRAAPWRRGVAFTNEFLPIGLAWLLSTGCHWLSLLPVRPASSLLLPFEYRCRYFSGSGRQLRLRLPLTPCRWRKRGRNDRDIESVPITRSRYLRSAARPPAMRHIFRSRRGERARPLWEHQRWVGPGFGCGRVWK